MKIFCDTNILVASFLRGHAHHQQARLVLERVLTGHDNGFVASHTLAEAYSVMTRLPEPGRVAPTIIWQLISENVVKPFTLISLTPKEQCEALEAAAAAGVEGGRIYDALLLAAARKSGAERIYTFNFRHFQSLAEEPLRSQIVSP